jgi:deoxyadenosine/deoxycytidine kinase
MVSGRKPYVSVCGPLASGKTTIATMLAGHFGWSPLLENVAANPYLRNYYGDMPRWVFRTVTAFMVRGLTLQDEITGRLANEAICQDWNFAEHYGIYGIHVFDEGLISEQERQTFEELHRYLLKHAPMPDLVIVLTAEPATLLTRIQSRHRPGELEVPLSYVEHLVDRYTDWVPTLGASYITIDTTTCDVVRDPEAFEQVIRRVQTAIS